MTLHPITCKYLIHSIIMTLCHQFAESQSPVRQEAFGLCRTSNHLASNGGKPFHEAVSAPARKFFGHPGRPSLAPCLVTVYHNVTQHAAQPVSARLVIHLKILLVIIPHCIRVQFVDFEPGRLRRSRSVLFACQIVSETVHFPSAFGNLPVKHPVTILAAEVDDILFRYCIPSFRSGIEVPDICIGEESGLFRVYVYPCNGMQTNFRVAQPVSFLICADANVSCRNRLDVKGIYGSGTRRKLFHNASVVDSVIAAFHLPVPSVALYASSCQCQCLDLSRGAKVKHYARVSVRSRSNLTGDVSVSVGQQFCPAVGTATHG